MKMTKLTAKFLSVAFAVLISSMGFLSCKKEKTKDVPLATVQQGIFYLDLYEEGEIEAINSINLSSPNLSWRFGNLKITQIVKDGSEVHKGDTVIVFDPSEVQKGIVEAESRLQMNMAELDRMQAQQQSDLEDLQADYDVSRISQEISKIRFESAVYEANIKKQEIKLNLDKANIALNRAKEQLDNRIKIQKEEIRQKQLSINQDEARLEEAKETLKKLFIVSPEPGIVIINRSWSTGNKYQVGDQCWSGMPLIQLPDLSLLRATVKINEVDISKIKKGLAVEIKPDAYSESMFKGEVTGVANLAVNKDNKSKIKVFPVEIKLNETSDKLMPGLSVSCRIIFDQIEDAIYIPLEALHNEGDKYFVYKKTAGGYEKTMIEVGESNANFIVVTKGLLVKEKVALANPIVIDENDKDKAKNEAKIDVN